MAVKLGFCIVMGHDDDPDEIRDVPVEIETVVMRESRHEVDVCLKHVPELRELQIIL